MRATAPPTAASMLLTSGRNGHLEVPAFFLKLKQGYTERKMEKVYIDKCRYEIQEKKFRYGIPAFTGPFRAIIETIFGEG
jgi:hypothetical protein